MSARGAASFVANSVSQSIILFCSYRLFLNRRAEVAALEDLARKTASAACAARAAALHASPAGTSEASLPPPNAALTPHQPQRRNDDECGAQDGDGSAGELVAPDGSSPSEFRRRDRQAAEWVWQRRWQQQQIQMESHMDDSIQHEQRKRDVPTTVHASTQCALPRQHYLHREQQQQWQQQEEEEQQQQRKHIITDDIGSLLDNNGSGFGSSRCSLRTSDSTIVGDFISHSSLSPGQNVYSSNAIQATARAMAPNSAPNKSCPCTAPRRTEKWY
jgi:hypothetical protein